MKKTFYPILLSTFVFFVVSSTVNALTISPARLEIKGDPGEVVTGEIILINDQKDSQTFYSSNENFEAQGETGTPTFVASKEGLSSWIQLQDTVTLQSGEQKKIPFSVHIPKDADAGGHFAAIFLSTVPPTLHEGQVSVGAKIGVLVLLKVSGVIKEGGGVLDFKTTGDSSFFTTLPVSFSYRFQNSGNDRVSPFGTVSINNTLGIETENIDANTVKGNVLPQSTRRFDVLWGENNKVIKPSFFESVSLQAKQFAFGFYTAHLHLSYGTNGVADSSKTIFVFPWQLLLIVLIALIIVGFVLIQVIIRYNRWIIQKAKQAISQK